uniref:TSA: Wollemia nobilis Ref_Wollemi_Transcript_21970_1125 transcribed RNA sequence n=1 Tax=Wollemia nobilis TaxID=56998 RepID=A0A0C9RHH0_9CONI
MEEKRVCVTGGSGFIGSWLVRLLLHRQYTVHATVQSLADPNEREHLEALEGANERLHLFQADVLDYDALAAAINGCQGLFHVASPCTLEEIKDPQAELLDPAVKGTMNALEAARKANVKRVVLTSSISSLVPNPNWPPNTLIDENCWTDIEYCERDKIWYPVSKTLAEKAAWEYGHTHKMDVVAIHPSTCLGPLLQPRLNASSAVLLNLIQGSQDNQSNYWLGCVHVEDVAKAHILLYETPSAAGRHLCTNGIIHFSDFAEVVAEICPEYPVHRFREETQPGLLRCKDAAKKLIDLGLCFTPIEVAIQQSITSMKERGFLC